LPSGTIGGDLYDVVYLGDGAIACLIFDVCGHGVPAALISAMAKLAFSHHLRGGETPRSIFEKVNSELVEFMPEQYFLTAFLGILNTKEKKFAFARAGNPAALLHHAASNSISYLNCNGAFIGLAANSRYDEQTVAVAAGDTIVLYTDGLIESMNRNNEFFGKRNLELSLTETPHAGPADAIAKIINDWEDFSRDGEQMDDVTLLAVKVL
jgi:serine phosphatase RsbU (regulator of sigma subunit)